MAAKRQPAPLHCIVTAGPTWELLDQVRRLTNRSTGRLGTELANFLSAAGHRVTLLLGEQATWAGTRDAAGLETFSSAADLSERLEALSRSGADAVFHAAAVSDFRFGKVWARADDGALIEQQSGKFSTRVGPLLAELLPTPKIVAQLRDWFPKALLAGWKYEVEGGRKLVWQAAAAQLRECRTDACVGNGPAYGQGFGLLTRDGQRMHLAGREELYAALEQWILERAAVAP